MNKEKIVKYQIIVCIVGIAVGVISLLCGISISNAEVSTTFVDRAVFGADYYTESHAAMAATANNIIDLIRVFNGGIAALLYITGLFIICYFALKAIEPLYVLKESKINQKNSLNVEETFESEENNDDYALTDEFNTRNEV
mgnify:FL=1